MSFKSFLPKSILLVVFCALISYWLLVALERSDHQNAALIGLGIGYLNALLGFLALSYGNHKPIKTFVVLFMGGMILRFLLIFAALFVLIRVFILDEVAILVPLIATYFLFLGLEIFLVMRAAESERINRDDNGFVAGR